MSNFSNSLLSKMQSFKNESKDNTSTKRVFDGLHSVNDDIQMNVSGLDPETERKRKIDQLSNTVMDKQSKSLSEQLFSRNKNKIKQLEKEINNVNQVDDDDNKNQHDDSVETEVSDKFISKNKVNENKSKNENEKIKTTNKDKSNKRQVKVERSTSKGDVNKTVGQVDTPKNSRDESNYIVKEIKDEIAKVVLSLENQLSMQHDRSMNSHIDALAEIKLTNGRIVTLDSKINHVEKKLMKENEDLKEHITFVDNKYEKMFGEFKEMIFKMQERIDVLEGKHQQLDESSVEDDKQVEVSTVDLNSDVKEGNEENSA